MNELTLHLTDTAFKPVIADGEVTLQRLLGNMVEKDSLVGSLTIKVDIELTPVDVPNCDPSSLADTRQVLIPKLTHKVSSVMQIKDETKGGSQYDDYELAWDEKLGEYVLKPIVSAQQSMFNDDRENTDAGETDEASAAPGKGDVPSLPAPLPTSSKTGGFPFAYLRHYIGQEMRVREALGNYTVRTVELGNGLHSVVLSSAFNPTDAFYCPAGKLKPHLGHKLVCGGEDEHGEECFKNDGAIFKAFIVCADCGDVLFSLKPDGDGDDEPEDASDLFDNYPYEKGAAT